MILVEVKRIMDINELNERFIEAIKESKKRLTKIYAEIQDNDRVSANLKNSIKEVLSQQDTL
jgi:CRISPR/Cas system CSM-associated protein Csm2 small subunit